VTTSYDAFGIKIDGDEEYERGVKWRLDFIGRSETGRALLHAIQLTGKQITIKKYRPKNQNDFNAATDALDEPAATAAGEFLVDTSGKPKTKTSFTSGWQIPTVMTGTGQGSNVEIYYDPSLKGFGSPAAAPANASFWGPTNACSTPSDQLFHEMVHAFRMMRGHSYFGRTMGGRALYDNEEEFFAIVLTNIFVSDPTTGVANRKLRADHHSYNTLAPAQSTSSGFVGQPPNQRLLAKFITQEPGLVNDLLNVRANFNPIKQLKQNMTSSNVTVVHGDALSDLAQKHFGSAEYWPLLWDANRATIGPNPNLIKPGMTLTIPPFSSFTPAQLQNAKQRFPTWRNYH
jgi:nucleoid-associated protein YgaU